MGLDDAVWALDDGLAELDVAINALAGKDVVVSGRCWHSVFTSSMTRIINIIHILCILRIWHDRSATPRRGREVYGCTYNLTATARVRALRA